MVIDEFFFKSIQTPVTELTIKYEDNCIIIIMFDGPVGPLVQCNILKHKCRHFVPPCSAVHCQGLKVFHFRTLASMNAPFQVAVTSIRHGHECSAYHPVRRET